MVDGTAPVSKTVTYHFNGDTTFETDGVITHRFSFLQYISLLALKLDGKHDAAKSLYESCRVKGDTDAV